MRPRRRGRWFGRYDRGIRAQRSRLFPYRHVIYTQSSGEDAPMTDRGIRSLWIMTAILTVPVGAVVYFAVRALV